LDLFTLFDLPPRRGLGMMTVPNCFEEAEDAEEKL
jgi:hypothetical protein